MHIRTKLVCTIGPAVDSREQIENLIRAGMNVARVNFSHGTHEEHGKRITLLREVREKLQVPLAIMLDTKGPEIRIGKVKEGQITLKEGDHLLLTKKEEREGIAITPPHTIDALQKGMFLFFDDGYIVTRVVDVGKERVKLVIDNGGVLSSNKGVNIPGASIELPPLTEKDIADIQFGCGMGIDYVAASFIRSSDHVKSIKKLLHSCKHGQVGVIAKIENQDGVANFDQIAEEADGIMIARGDLGVELPLPQVPRLQKMMIRKSNEIGKPSVTATQMLESMIKNPRPTRAETSDVANAIYDGTAAVMLSGETAIGKYPIEALRVMKAIIHETETDVNFFEFAKQNQQRVFPDVPSSVALASIKTAYSANAKAIFAFSSSGSTPRLLSRFRPEMPIIAFTPDEKAYHQLALFWGVIPIFSNIHAKNIDEAYEILSTIALERNLVKKGDLVVVTAGTPFGTPGTTNMMFVDKIGKRLH